MYNENNKNIEKKKAEDVAATLRLPGNNRLTIRNEDIDDIMSSALDYCYEWCREVVVVGDYRGEYASEQISRDGELVFIEDCDMGNLLKGKTLTKTSFIIGLFKWIKEEVVGNEIYDTAIETVSSHECVLNPGMIDGPAADAIIQYALFGELVYS